MEEFKEQKNNDQRITSLKDLIFKGKHHLGIMELFRLSLRVFKLRPLRTFLTIFGMSVGIGTVLFLVSLGYGLQYLLIGKLAATEDSLITLEAFYPSENNLHIDSDTLDSIINSPGNDEISPVAEFAGEAKINSLSGFLMVKIVNPNYFRLSGFKPDIGSVFTEEEKSIIISSTAFKLFNLKEDESSLGKDVSLRVFYQDEGNSDVQITEIPSVLKIKGIVTDEFQLPFIIIPNDLLKDKPPFYQRVLVKAVNMEQLEPLKDNLIGKGFLISARIDLVNQTKKIMTIITVVLGIFGVAALVVSAIGMFNTIVIGFLERIFEVGIMKSIGATSKDIRNLFLMESLMMGMLGGIGGIAIGILLGESINFGLNFLAKYLGGKEIDIFIYPIRFLIFIVILSALVGIFSGFWPARRAAKLSPKQAFIRK